MIIIPASGHRRVDKRSAVHQRRRGIRWIALFEANRLGCDCQGFDLNPMAAWIVREELAHLDLAAYDAVAVIFDNRQVLDLDRQGIPLIEPKRLQARVR